MTVMTDERVSNNGGSAVAVDDDGANPAWAHPHFEVLPLDVLFADERYQRELTSLADEIAEGVNPAMLGTLTVSLRAGGKVSPKGPGGRLYAVIDGQTRLRGVEGALAAGRWAPTELAALVYTGMTVAQEAKLFADLQRKRRNIATYQRFRAALVAKDPMTVSIHKILKPFDLAVGPRRDNDIQAVAALESVWKRDHHVEDVVDADDNVIEQVVKGPPGTPLLARTVGILHSAWAEEDARDAYSSDMIRGVSRFISDSNVDDDRLIKRLRQTTPAKLRIRAGMLREGKGGGGHTSTYMADAILTEYTRRG